jgi:flagellar M-ring protein FliF
MNFLTNIFGSFKQFYGGLSAVRKAMMFLMGSVVVVVLVVMSFWAGESSYSVLFRQLTAQDSVAVTKWLSEKKIPYLIQDGGATISVPPEFTSTARLGVMGADIINADTVGYEIFNKDNFGMTSFVQKINYKRAQEGELVRTIQSLSSVRRARVSITTPPERTFAEDKEDSKASVFLELEPGAKLAKEEIHSITNLVASAVEGLKPENVSIVDNRGRMLHQPASGFTAQTQMLLDYKMEMEKKLENQVRGIVEKVVGEGFVEVRVNADVDFKRSSVKRKEVDANGIATLSTQRKEDTLQGRRPNPTGVPGSRSEIPGAPPQGTPTVSQDVNKTFETVNYIVPETNTQEDKIPGQIQRLTIAVLLDPQSLEKTPVAGQTANPADPKAAPGMDPNFKTKLEGLVANAVGYSKDRGDQVHIEVMPFARPAVDEGDAHLRLIERREALLSLIKYGVPSIFLLVFFMWVVRPFVKWVTTNTSEAVEKQLPQTVEELESKTGLLGTVPGMENLPLLEEQVDPDKAEGELLKEKIISMVESSPSKAAQIIQEWLQVDMNRKK